MMFLPQAYLNQLSRKTHHLKQDGQPWEDSVSSPSGGDHPPSELSVSSNLSFHAESREPKTYSHRKTPGGGGGGGHLSDITALSEKYSHSKGEKSVNKDKFSTLEEKYLKKYNINASSTNKSHELLKETKHRNNLAERSEGRDRSGTKNQEPKERKTQASAVYSSEEIDDENLAHYLRQVSLTSEEYSGNKYNNDTNNKTDDSIDDVLNLKNIIDADILGEDENSDKSYHLSPVDQSVGSSNNGAGRSKSQPEISKHAVKSQSNAVQVTKEEQTEASRAKNILSPSKSSLFYSNRQQKDDEEEEEKQHPPVRLLLSQAGSNLFHSSRRKSSIVFNEIHEGKVKPKPSKQTHKVKAKARHKSASEDTIDTASENHISEQVPGIESGDDLASRSVTSEGTQEQVEEDSHVSSLASTVKSEGRGGREGSIQHNITSSQTRHSIDSDSPGKSKKKYNKSSSSKDYKSDHRRKSHKESNSHHHKGRKGDKITHRKRKETERSKWRSKKKHRSPSLSSSSSSSSSSESELSYSMSKSARHRSRSHKKSNRRSTHCHWVRNLIVI